MNSHKADAKRLFEINHHQITSVPCGHDSLLSGNLGLAYYYSYLYKAEGSTAFKDQAAAILDNVLNRFTETGANLIKYTYSGGVAGLAYTITQLNSSLELGLELDSELQELDEYLFSSAMTLLESGNIDALHGALGIIHYFELRQAKGYINDLFTTIYNNREVNEHGIWFNNTVDGLSTGVGEANLSISHGLTGILLILIKCAPLLSVTNKVLLESLVQEGIRFILSVQMIPDFLKGHYAYFPPSLKVAENSYEKNCRLAWCYGDLGIVLLLYRAGKMLRNGNYITLADKLGDGTTLRKTGRETDVSDILFCHGTLGLVTFYNVLFKESGKKEYLNASDYWMEESIRRFDSQDHGITDTTNPHGLLDGLVGANLALLSYQHDHLTTWAGVFFL